MDPRITELAATLEKLETESRTKEPFDGALKSYQGEVLARLKELRSKLGESGGGGGGGGSSSLAAGGSAQSESEKLLKENAELKKTIAKQNYRISHLVNMLTEEEEKNR